METVEQYIYFVRGARPDFAPDNTTDAERRVIGDHFVYLQEALAGGTVILVGRTQEAPYVGICIFEAPNRAAAEEFLKNDPAVAHGVFTGTVQSYAIALQRS